MVYTFESFYDNARVFVGKNVADAVSELSNEIITVHSIIVDSLNKLFAGGEENKIHAKESFKEVFEYYCRSEIICVTVTCLYKKHITIHFWNQSDLLADCFKGSFLECDMKTLSILR